MSVITIELPYRYMKRIGEAIEKQVEIVEGHVRNDEIMGEDYCRYSHMTLTIDTRLTDAECSVVSESSKGKRLIEDTFKMPVSSLYENIRLTLDDMAEEKSHE